MRFSLIVATLGRTQELRKFLNSLKKQIYQNFEVIIVDQNNDNRLIPIISEFSFLDIIHVKSKKGLSLSRNIGLKSATGDIIAFPDDDCWYLDTNTLIRVKDIFSNNQHFHCITGITVDSQNNSAAAKFDNKSGFVNIYNLWRRGNSTTIFVLKTPLSKINGFDTNLGLGAKTKWQSGEESDLLVRLIKNNYTVYYYADLKIGHPNPTIKYNNKTLERGFNYSLGFGKVLSKHDYPLWFVFFSWFKPFMGIILSLVKLNFKKSLYHYFVLKGRIIGWVS